MWWVAISAAWAFDHGHAQLGAVLAGAVTDGGVDYRLLAARRPALDVYLREIAAASPAGWTREQRLAFYVNAYNALTIALILDSGPPKSIRDLDGGKVWTTRVYTVGGERLTLDQIEQQRARPLSDGRVHGVLNCASRGCPPLPPTPIAAATVEAQLDEGARRWARTNAFSLNGDAVALSSIFDWYGDDFAKERRGDLAKVDGDAESALWFLARFVEPAIAQRLTSGALTATWSTYDWSLNSK